MAGQTLIKMHKNTISDVQNEIKKLKSDVSLLKKLYVILDVINDVPIKDIVAKHAISQGTVYNWINKWNTGGIDALKRKKGSKGKSKLTDMQFIILDKIISQMKLKTSKKVKHIIESVFGVTYSIRQIERIMKKLDYVYDKPYYVSAKMPKDAEDQLITSTKHLDLENYIIMFLDQTYCQNQENSHRTYHKKGTKNIALQPEKKLSINGVGVQAINGRSSISFLENTRTFEMMKFIVGVTINNITNEKLKTKLSNIINNEDLNIENILNTVNQEENYDKLLIALKDLSEDSKTFKNLLKRVEKNPLSLKTKSITVLENLQKAMLLSYFYDKKLQKELIMEKPIAMVLDNYKVHHALPFKKICNFLNMDLIYLPPNSPKYNPIEQVWRTIKARISRRYITSMQTLEYEFKKEYMDVVDNSSYWDNWCGKFVWNYNI